jgi:type IV pilus assembly protein PilB
VRPERDFVLAQLTEDGVLTAESAERAVRQAAESKVTPTQAAVELGLVTAVQAAIATAAVSECLFVDLRHYDIDLKNAMLLARSAAEKRLAFPLFLVGKSVVVGMADPTDLGAVDRIRSLLHTEVETVLCEAGALRSLIERAYSMSGTGGPAAERLQAAGAEAAGTEDEPIVAAVNQILTQAIERNASGSILCREEEARATGILAQFEWPACEGHRIFAEPAL